MYHLSTFVENQLTINTWVFSKFSSLAPLTCALVAAFISALYSQFLLYCFGAYLECLPIYSFCLELFGYLACFGFSYKVWECY